ncbi:MAG: DUF4253 domain-containing protein [Asgard group archaeon]|nr:DUF4253 domain-containing protein [Asgard group archaeon]
MLSEDLKEILESNGLDFNRLIIDAQIKIGDYNLTFYQTDGIDAQQVWMRFRELKNQTGLQPFIVMDEYYYQTKINPEEIEKVIESSQKIDGKVWLQNKLAKEGTIKEINNKQDIEFQELLEEIGEQEKEVLTEQSQPLETFRIPLSDDRLGFKETVTIFLFPVKKPWQVLAYLNIGALQDIYKFANEEEHLAVMKYWYEKYGAEPSGLYSGELEFYVSKPPTEYEKAFNLAFEQYAYCHDCLKLNGFGSFDLFSKVLVNSTVWYFGWLKLINQM